MREITYKVNAGSPDHALKLYKNGIATEFSHRTLNTKPIQIGFINNNGEFVSDRHQFKSIAILPGAAIRAQEALGDPNSLIFTIRVENGTVFNIRWVKRGTQVKDQDVFLDADDLLLFYDAKNKNAQNPLGTYTRSQFSAAYLMGIPTAQGLDLREDTPEWFIDSDSLNKIIEWIKSHNTDL